MAVIAGTDTRRHGQGPAAVPEDSAGIQWFLGAPLRLWGREEVTSAAMPRTAELLANVALPGHGDPSQTASKTLNIGAMRTNAVGVLDSDTLPWEDEPSGRITDLIPAVETVARSRPVDSVRSNAPAEIEEVQKVMASGPGIGLGSKVQHVKTLARQLQALRDHHDLLTGAKLMGTA